MKVANKIVIKPLEKSDIKTIYSWKYDGEYAVYNLKDYEIAKKEKSVIFVDAIRQREFFSFSKEDCIIGYFRIYNSQNDHVSLGIAMAPEQCGKGYGVKCISMIIQYIRDNYDYKYVALEVRQFNIRAIKCYSKIGFTIIDTYIKGDDRIWFYKMLFEL